MKQEIEKHLDEIKTLVEIKKEEMLEMEDAIENKFSNAMYELRSIKNRLREILRLIEEANNEAKN